MKVSINDEYSLINEIYITEIWFDIEADDTNLTIIGYIENPSEPEHFSCEFSILMSLLLYLDKEHSAAMQLLVAKVLDSKAEEKYINILEHFKKPLHITHAILTIETAQHFTITNGDYYKKSVQPYHEQYYYITKCEIKNSVAPYDELTIEEKDFSFYAMLLRNTCKFYHQLKALNIDTKQARAICGLDNELLFRLCMLHK
ncbi:MAG: hypothetical protein RL660_1726 [Bacteroidota bacterium]|jgi:hypothetical protein